MVAVGLGRVEPLGVGLGVGVARLGAGLGVSAVRLGVGVTFLGDGVVLAGAGV